jgi:hypothetical protein
MGTEPGEPIQLGRADNRLSRRRKSCPAGTDRPGCRQAACIGCCCLTVRAGAGATIPALPRIAAGLLAGGVLLAAGGVLLIVLPVRRASAHPAQT